MPKKITKHTALFLTFVKALHVQFCFRGREGGRERQKERWREKEGGENWLSNNDVLPEGEDGDPGYFEEPICSKLSTETL